MAVAIETTFPSAQTNRLAEQESWRKEINRPTYHMHKWWATRLGSVFRAILIGALSPEGTDVEAAFYQAQRFPDATVLDPMMGSGTTIGEALKLGCRVVGQDINPVSYIQVRAAVAECDPVRLDEAYRQLERTVAPRIRALYCVADPDEPQAMADTLYAFWVKVVSCPACGQSVRLFKNAIFARHAYPQRVPEVHSVCPQCGEINQHHGSVTSVLCRDRSDGGHSYNPQVGPAQGAWAICPDCARRFKILDAIHESGPASQALYASLVLTSSGEKRYVRARPWDLVGLEVAKAALRAGGVRYPDDVILPGHNTNQLLSHGYRHWRELFTERQLYSLGLLAEAIRDIPDPSVRDLLALLLSGTVEFNNHLCSYKGEGTGAVRPAFSHHILKPERTPLENAVWGLPESSGCFSTLYRSRLLKGLAYRKRAFELRVVDQPGSKPTVEKVYGLAAPMSVPLAGNWQELVADQGRALIRCGDARTLLLPDASVDAIVTDPPYFDFVHYSELADLFQGWLRLMLGMHHPPLAVATTRHAGEVQQRDPVAFSHALCAVLQECRRVLKPGGILAFTFHHSRSEGWSAVGRAILDADLAVVAAHQVKAELSVATPKSAANEAIDIDAILVCKRRSEPIPATLDDVLRDIAEATERAITTYRAGARRQLTRGDLLVLLQSQALVAASRHEGALYDANRAPLTLPDVVTAAGSLVDRFAAPEGQRAVAD